MWDLMPSVYAERDGLKESPQLMVVAKEEAVVEKMMAPFTPLYTNQVLGFGQI